MKRLLIQNAADDYGRFDVEIEGRGIVARVEVLEDAPFGRELALHIASAPVTAARLERAVTALELAEGFISGFEDDEAQEGVTLLLAMIRASVAENGLPEAQHWAKVDAEPVGHGEENDDCVRCTWCEFDGTVKMGAEVCPQCRRRGTLADA